ncbi:methyltransferase domain-containing protein [Thermomonas mangrovi]|uniref:methyltransferase domain-containing protein n=1 Tax=Thermomonas mangrovi TaxID=2993316 RepID=UPI002306DE9D|nr:methyltransferase domain-containing protein [Thermomonas mangrovi]
MPQVTNDASLDDSKQKGRLMTRGPSQRDIQAYENVYASDYDFEPILVRYRRDAALRSLREHKPDYIIEIGCGLEPLLPHYLASGEEAVRRWVVAEPAQKFAEAARMVAADHPEMAVEQGFFEDIADRIVSEYGRADMVICSGLLHEVPDQIRMLHAISQVMGPDAVVHVSVANATSLHRRMAKAMGLIDDLQQMSGRNLLLQQHRVYTLESLIRDLQGAGLQPVKQGGILLKPFTHEQMRLVLAAIGSDVLAGLGKLGEEFPELASEIFVDARLVEG